MAFKEYRDMKVYEQGSYNMVSTPTIILKGHWLREIGFEHGTPITVKCEGGRLTITPKAVLVMEEHAKELKVVKGRKKAAVLA